MVATLCALAILLLSVPVLITRARPAAAVASTAIVSTLQSPESVAHGTHLKKRTAGKAPEFGPDPVTNRRSDSETGVTVEEKDGDLTCDVQASISNMRALQRRVLESLFAALTAARAHDDASTRSHVAEGRRLSLLIESSRETLLQECCGDARSRCASQVHAQINAGLQQAAWGAQANANGPTESRGKSAASSNRLVGNGEVQSESEEMEAEEGVLNLFAQNSEADAEMETGPAVYSAEH